MAARFTLALAMMDRTELLSNPWRAKSFSAASRILCRVLGAIEPSRRSNSNDRFNRTFQLDWTSRLLSGLFGPRWSQLLKVPSQSLPVAQKSAESDGPMDIRLRN